MSATARQIENQRAIRAGLPYAPTGKQRGQASPAAQQGKIAERRTEVVHGGIPFPDWRSGADIRALPTLALYLQRVDFPGLAAGGAAGEPSIAWQAV